MEVFHLRSNNQDLLGDPCNMASDRYRTFNLVCTANSRKTRQLASFR